MKEKDVVLYLGEEIRSSASSGTPPVYQTSNFVFESVQAMREALIREDELPFYTRGTNPTVQLLQAKMAALEGTESALILGSGSAAIAAGLLANLKYGDHILAVANPYSWTKKLIQRLERWGIAHTFADGSDTASFLSCVQKNTKVIYLESPNSWTYEMQDLETIAAFAKSRNILTMIDNSFASPINQHPANYGIDLIAHSATKYLNGHSDVVAGVLCASKVMIKSIFQTEYMMLGGVVSPNDASLILRSLRTLPMRMKAVAETTLEVIAYLEQHPKVAKLHHPHAKGYPQQELTAKYLSQPSGLFTIDLVERDSRKVEAFCNALKRFKAGPSWGSYKSLYFPAIALMTSQNYQSANILPERIRFGIGFDEAEDLITDLDSAFKIL
ncbi:MAG: aminotransferase class V-fold PLP-dependent enzyme [Cyclobacteriaceae bacterium]|nr:aminotransferase class V-fold PLP-dependent enzyme [Cyclobacteriaceae bacterium HetDA_MAG_MS6]